MNWTDEGLNNTPDPTPWNDYEEKTGPNRIAAFVFLCFFVVSVILAGMVAERVWTSHNAERIESQ